MTKDDKYKKKGYEIYPFKVFMNVIGVTSGLVTLILAIIFFNGLYITIAIMSLTIILLLAYIIVFWLRLDKVLKDYNGLLKDFLTLEENRDTLVLMYEKQSEENKSFENELIKEKSRVFVLAKLIPSNGNPEIKNLKQALGISYEEVDEK